MNQFNIFFIKTRTKPVIKSKIFTNLVMLTKRKLWKL